MFLCFIEFVQQFQICFPEKKMVNTSFSEHFGCSVRLFIIMRAYMMFKQIKSKAFTINTPEIWMSEMSKNISNRPMYYSHGNTQKTINWDIFFYLKMSFVSKKVIQRFFLLPFHGIVHKVVTQLCDVKTLTKIRCRKWSKFNWIASHMKWQRMKLRAPAFIFK